MRWRNHPSADHVAHRFGLQPAGSGEEIGKPEERPSKTSLRNTAAPVVDAALIGVHSPIARRYLACMVARDGRLAKESYSGSIVNAAFTQAWILTSRMNLTEAQQDRLAEFLLREDWLRWDSMDPRSIEDWARQNLSADQQATLKEFLAEQKEGAAIMAELRQSIQRLEHGDRSESEIFAAEMAALKAVFPTDDASQHPGPPAAAEMDAATRKQFAESVQTEQAFRYYNLLADRIPLTPEQHQAVYASLREGQQAPINPYAYQTLASDRAEAAVRRDTEWLGAILTNVQYETYVAHFLAEIEMIRFQTSR
jgi:hypothetical protein